MTLEKFKNEMSNVKNFINEQNVWQDCFSKLMPDSYPIVSLGSKLLEDYIHLIQDSFMETNEEDWIFYYIYDCEVGEKPMEVKKDGKVIVLDNEEKLYYIMLGKW